MNDTVKALKARKSTRVFTDMPVMPQIKAELLRCAAAAPTAGNQQMYTILDITDQSLKDRLAESCDHQPFIAKAPMVLIFCADFQKWYDGFRLFGCEPRKPGVGDLMLAVSDATIAAQNVVVAAESFGLGSCYIGDIMEQCELHREMLKLPNYVFPCCMLVIGYPTMQQRRRAKPERLDMELLVHENGYRPLGEEELAQLLRNEGEMTKAQRFQAFCQRKYNSEFSREMTRSVEKYLEEFRKED